MQGRGVALSLLMAVLVTGTAMAQTKPAPKPAAKPSGVVNVYNWSDYIDPQIVKDFERETGIRVRYDVYDNNEIVETKLLTGKSGYDVVVPSMSSVQRLIQAGVLQPLNATLLPNRKNLWPMITQRVATYDPGNRFAVPYMWGTVGFAYNEAAIKKRMPNAPVDSWRMVFDPTIASRFRDCGIYWLDTPIDMFPSLLAFAGKAPDSKNAADFQAAADMAMKARPTVRKFHSSESINALANGDICMAIGYSGDMLQARNRAAEAKRGIKINYVIPKEGAQIWFDLMVIPRDAPNAANAHRFINYMMRPDVIAKASNYVSYANGNLASKALVDPSVRNDPGVYPSDAVMKKLFTITPHDARTQRVATRQWTRIKTGR
jgi:putrescine transport system substrate-binding protein